MKYTLDMTQSTLEVWTYKEGLLSRVAHDLCFRASGWTAELELEEGRFSVRVVVPVHGLRVRGQVKGDAVLPLKYSDQEEIESNLRGKSVLAERVDKDVVYVAEGTEGTRGAVFTVGGQLTLRGRARDLPVQVTIEADGEALRVRGEVSFLQSSFGIKPYSALLGALKIKDTVRVSWALCCVPAV